MTTKKLLGKTPILIAFALLASALQLAAATFTVTNVKDSGAGSLRAAIEAANTNGEADTINFDPTFFNVARTITLTTGEILITPDDQHFNGQTGRLVTINGPGANLLTISGNNASRIFLLAGNPGQEQQNANVTMNGMTLRDGNGVGGFGGVSNAIGGAIYAQLAANLTLNSMVIRNNVITTNSNSSGGGMYFNGVKSVAINDSLITENSANNAGGFATYLEVDKLTMRNTIVSNNRAISGNTGGISIYRGTNVITNCQITGNNSKGAYGGIDFFQAEVDMSDTIISGNVAGATGGGTVGGINTNGGAVVTFRRVTVSNNFGASGPGGIQIRNPSGIVTIIDSTVSNNSADGIPPSRQGAGGGISVSDAGTQSGQITRIINSTISGNSAAERGGGIYNFSTGLELINSTVVNNSAGASNFVRDGGGGIFDGEILRSGNGEFLFRPKLQNSIIAGNTAGNGPDLYSGFDSAGYNIIGNTANTNNSAAATGDQFNVDPKVGPLANNGGPTLTHALLPGSPAIDKGKSADVITDQRALPRPFNNLSVPNAAGGDGSDIGAFEDQPANTTKGSDVSVEAPAGDATVTFQSITKAGFTTFAAIVPPSSAGLPPEGYNILEGAPAYDINTTATFTAPITVCFTVNSITDADVFARVRILHGEDGELVDRTDLQSLDFASRTVCAEVDSLSPFVVALAPSLPNRFQNISTRLRVETGEDVLIGGFIVTGTETKTVILRAIGPSLADFGVTGVLADPVLELHGGDGSLITSNDNWKTTQKAAIIATGVPPTNDKESAIIAELEPGATYTLVVKGKSGGSGVALVEAYDLAGAADSEFANISTRGKVGTGANVMIGGFILAGGTGDNTVLVRALGPSLGDAGVSGALADPTLELRDPDGNLVRSNDNWKDDQMAAILATGIPPTKNLESALVQTLGPGNYTAIVAGKDGGIGVGLVEAFRLQ